MQCSQDAPTTFAGCLAGEQQLGKKKLAYFCRPQSVMMNFDPQYHLLRFIRLVDIFSKKGHKSLTNKNVKRNMTPLMFNIQVAFKV